MNVACFIGKLTADPVVTMTPKGTKNCSFSIAVNRKYKNADGSYPVDFIRCVAWRNTAVFIETYFKKGNNIGINGSIQTRTYQEKNTGKTITVVEVVVDNAYFCSDKSGKVNAVATHSESVESQSDNTQETNYQGVLDDFSSLVNDDGDLPF